MTGSRLCPLQRELLNLGLHLPLARSTSTAMTLFAFVSLGERLLPCGEYHGDSARTQVARHTAQQIAAKEVKQ